jgi:hypothetical protein
MSAKLVYGVLDIPYGEAYVKDTGQTVPEVAGYLEDKYHIFETFHEAHEEEVLNPIKATLAALLVDSIMGRPVNLKASVKQSSGHIRPLFHDFLDNQEMDGFSGVPTELSLKGVTHRRKKKKITGSPRPSFENSLFYRNAMRSWLEIS